MRTDDSAFTLLDLLAVLATALILAGLFIPAFAGTRMDIRNLQCKRNAGVIGTGFSLYEQDHGQMFPPASYYENSLFNGPTISWDSYLHRYIGGRAIDSLLTLGHLPVEVSPAVLVCPADARVTGGSPDVSYNPGGLIFGRRSYAMVDAGITQTNWTVPPLPPPEPIRMPEASLGVGLRASGSIDDDEWNPTSYKTSFVKDPSGTILLVEQVSSGNLAGNPLPASSYGPMATNSTGILVQLYQMAPVPGGINYGLHTYQFHGARFNYLFHDGHVSALKIEQTIGTGTTNAPKGMWTIQTGD